MPAHTQATLARWCRNRSYLDSATAHGITALTSALAGGHGCHYTPPRQQPEIAAHAGP